MLEQQAEALQAEPLATKRSRVQKVSVNTSSKELIPAKHGKRSSNRNADMVRRKVYLSHMEPMAEEFFEVLRLKVREGDMQAMKLSAEINQFIAAKGPAVAVAISNRNEARAESTSQSATGFDSLIRRLDERDSKIARAKDFLDV